MTANQLWLLKNRRVHEVCGSAAMAFALIMASRKVGPVMFIDAMHSSDQLHPMGAGCFMDMGRLLIARVAARAEILWTAEEALRSGCVPVVIARIESGLDLTAGRRLQLAAESGQSTGMLILPDGMGSNAAETRWNCKPICSPAVQAGSTLFEWNCIKNKAGTIGRWMVRWNETTHHIDILSPDGDRSLFAAAVG